jgi:cell division protein FtsI/penicillin-binding protein 2
MARQTKKSKKQNHRQIAFTRFMIVIAVFVVWIGGISARLVHLQVNQHEWLSAKARGQRIDLKKSRMPRGTIFDRNQSILAMSIKVKTLYANPMEIDDLDSAAKVVGKALGVNEKQLLRQLKDAKEDERKFVMLAKDFDEQAVARLNRELESPDVKKADSPKFAGLHWRE